MNERFPDIPSTEEDPLTPEVRRALTILAFQKVHPNAPWQQRALSQFAPDPRIFDERWGELSRARAFCEACEVTAECLEDALETDMPGEFRGGKTNAQRKAIKRERSAE